MYHLILGSSYPILINENVQLLKKLVRLVEEAIGNCQKAYDATDLRKLCLCVCDLDRSCLKLSLLVNLVLVSSITILLVPCIQCLSCFVP